MTQFRQVYVCEKCGNIVEVLHPSGGTLTCCNQAMTLAEENTTDAAQEKHVPVIERIDGGKVKVSVGSVAHPMADDHFIEWIEVHCGENTCRKRLAPGAPPEATFNCTCETAVARAYCNLHGLWKN